MVVCIFYLLFLTFTNLHILYTFFLTFFSSYRQFKMNRKTLKQTFIEAQVDNFSNQKARTVMSRRGGDYGRDDGCARGQGRRRTVVLSTSMPERQ